jgi:WD40 repeat protein
VNTLYAHSQEVSKIKQSFFDGQYIATCSYNELKIWHSSNWSLIRAFSVYAYDIEWINEENIASSGGFNRSINILSITTGQTLRTIKTYSDVRGLQLLKNGIHLAAGLLSVINIYDLRNGELISRLRFNGESVNYFSLLSQNDLLASSNYDYTVRIWNLTTKTVKFVLKGQYITQSGLKQLSSDVLACGDEGYSIKLWNITNGYLIRNITNLGVRFDLLNTQTLLIAPYGGTLNFLDWKTGEKFNTTEIEKNSAITSLAVVIPSTANTYTTSSSQTSKL